MVRRFFVPVVAFMFCAGVGGLLSIRALASPLSQELATATPAQVSLPTSLPFVTAAPAASPTFLVPTATATEVGPIVLEAVTEANVRAEPDPDAALLGVIRPGTFYPVIGRYYRWIQFQYDQSQAGTAWIYDELVTFIGDQSTIPDLTEASAPPPNPPSQFDTADGTLVPGALETATAAAGSVPLPGVNAAPNTVELERQFVTPMQVLPTFTFPPSGSNLPTPTPLANAEEPALQSTREAQDGNPMTSPTNLPPILPIGVLAGLGLLGLLIAALRR